MSSLNLSPNPGFILAQACVFLANVYAVNRLIVQPYLKLKDRRHRVTKGGIENAARTRAECDQIASQISEQIENVQNEIKISTSKIKEKANLSQEAVIGKAKAEAAIHLERLRSELYSEVQAERKKIPGVVDSLVETTHQALAN